MFKHAVKKLLFIIRCVPDKYKTQQMCAKATLENGGTFESVPNYYKNPRMYDRTVDNYYHALKSFPDCYRTQKMCDKAVNTYHSTTQFVPKSYKTQELCDQELSIDVLLHLFIFLINIKLKKYVTLLCHWRLKILFR